MVKPGAAEAGPSHPGAVAVAAAAMVIFAACAHRPWPEKSVAVAGLLVAAGAVERSLRGGGSMARMLGFGPERRRLAALVPVGAALGLGLAMLARWAIDRPLLPHSLQPFVLLACAVGAAEEVVYRGWMQGRLAGLGRASAIGLAALAHAGYKTALFVWPAGGQSPDLVWIGAWTALGGIGIGALREAARSTWPSIAAHVVFDLVMYGAFASAPWWLWG